MFQVLIAEDELWIRSAIGEMVEKLSPEFHVVGEVGNGEEAWNFIQEHWPAILITDIMMPRQNGLWLAEQIYEHELPMSTIIVSGYDNFQYAKQAMRFGIFEYLLKPLNVDELHESLRRSARRLAGMTDTRDTIGRIQQFADALPDLSQAELLEQIDSLVNDTFALKTPPGIRTNLLSSLSSRLNEFLRGIDPQFGGMPLAAEGEEAIRHHFHQLIDRWMDMVPQYGNQNVKLAIRRVRDHIDKHYTHNYSLPEAAEMAHLSVSHFSSLFKKSTGLTYLNYVNQLRIEKAKELLLAPEVKIYEVADQVGFTSLPYFNRVFKQLVGTTPLEFRKRRGI
ncbi:response regulator transcription factor [Paenibacillus thalictri]|uniref:Response regulator n=1 Tax=Paenibacillus thalictri TaxID=2527873 RepID=A0A4Q9DNX2_9BACL|nr:response regulator [Paenibacillus thalictri]TBL74601.1 response regulator [Paenibacillus thalictri]